MTLKKFNFFAFEYKKYAEFYASIKSVEIIRKKYNQITLFTKNFIKLVA